MPPVRSSSPSRQAAEADNRLPEQPTIHLHQREAQHETPEGSEQLDELDPDSSLQYPASDESSLAGQLRSGHYRSSVVKTSGSYCSSQYPHKLLKNLNQLRAQRQFCDVQIVAGGGTATYPAHRFVLSAASAYFEAMFRPELGLTEVYQKTIILHTIDADILGILLDFIYTGQCDINRVNVSISKIYK